MLVWYSVAPIPISQEFERFHHRGEKNKLFLEEEAPTPNHYLCVTIKHRKPYQTRFKISVAEHTPKEAKTLAFGIVHACVCVFYVLCVRKCAISFLAAAFLLPFFNCCSLCCMAHTTQALTVLKWSEPMHTDFQQISVCACIFFLKNNVYTYNFKEIQTF